MSIPYYNVTRSHRLLSPLIFFRCSIFFSMQNGKHVLRGSEHCYRDILVRFKQPRKAFSVAKLDGNSSGSQGVPRQKDAKPLLTSMFSGISFCLKREGLVVGCKKSRVWRINLKDDWRLNVGCLKRKDKLAWWWTIQSNNTKKLR